MQLALDRVDWPFKTPFRIAYRERTHAACVQATLTEGGLRGRGEALGVSYHGETADTIIEQLTAVASAVEKGIDRNALSALLPAGGARCALDCALWDLEARRAGARAWEMCGITHPRSIRTALTLGLDTIDATARIAASASHHRLLKIKLNGEDDIERVAHVRGVRPDAELIVDANQSWTLSQLTETAPVLRALDVCIIEQPLPAGADDAINAGMSDVPLCADESCQRVSDLGRLVGRYAFVCIKLDKTGGLTAALELAKRAREAGFKLMVGCMGGSSLAMAPAFVLAQFCDVFDLDGPLLLKADVPSPIGYEGDLLTAPSRALWG